MAHKDAAHSFFAQPKEVQESLLAKARSKISFSQEMEDLDRLKKSRLRLNTVRAKESHEEIWNEIAGEGGINLGDGWCRIFTLNKYGLLQVYCLTRLEEEWLQELSKDAKSIKDMSVWPQGTLKGNPWREPHFHSVVVALPVWNEEIQQFSISFDGEVYVEPTMSEAARARRLKKRMAGVKSKVQKQFSTLTYYFGREIIKDIRLPGYWTPRKQMQARPWKQGDRIIRSPKVKVPAFFQPDDHDLLIIHSDEGLPAKKVRLVRRHLSERVDLPTQEVKEVIEYWLKVFGYGDPFPR